MRPHNNRCRPEASTFNARAESVHRGVFGARLSFRVFFYPISAKFWTRMRSRWRAIVDSLTDLQLGSWLAPLMVSSKFWVIQWLSTPWSLNDHLFVCMRSLSHHELAHVAKGLARK